MRAVIYSRVSTDAQEQDGTSLETQERAALEFARERGWVTIETIRDTASGYSLDRPGMERIRRLMRDGLIDVILAYAVDRLARNQTKLAVLIDEAQEANVALECVTEKLEDTAVGRFIMSARGFAAEIEREKISERTMRGKLERARSGRIPQAFGLGCYGYTYNRETGKREIEALQAEVVRRIFQRYAETRSFGLVARELNQAGITTFTGSSWHPLTIRQTLRNESYTGRLLYRRTKSVMSRGTNGKRVRRYVDRPQDEWIEIDGASPRIIDDATWERVQEILDDPARIARRPTANHYPLRGRTKCGICGSAAVGQTLTPNGKPYRYYSCTHAYSRQPGKSCASRYIRADRLEEAVWREVSAVLTNPSVVLQELARPAASAPTEEIERIERDIAALTNQEKRLVRLYTLGEVDDAFIKEEGQRIRRERSILEESLIRLRGIEHPAAQTIDRALLERTCNAVAAWLANASEADRALALEALQVAITVTREKAEIRGVLPQDAPEFIAEEHASRCI